MTRPIRAGYEKLAAFLGRDMNLIHALALVGLILRLFVALKSEQIYHADELFQYLEQAHRLVFGYGHITWEFRWGARSWILPGFISSILFFCKALNLDTPTVYIPVVKVFFSVISISLIYSVYFATRRIATPQAATLASLFACFWYELIYFAARATPEVLAAYLIVGALALVLADTDARRPLLFGLLCALAVALRLQYAIPVLALIAYAAYKWRAADLQRAALSFLLVAVAAGYLDRLTWGKMFASYVNSFVFNVQYNISSLVFGISDPSFYPLALAIASSGLLLAGALAAIWKWRNTWLVLALVISTIAAHSLIPHKEYRFVFVVIPLLLILLATALSPDFLATLSHRLRQGWRTSSILAFIGISMAGAANALPFERFVYANPVTARSEALDAALVLSQENDVQAVINIASKWYETGGYSYLH
ncbi:MAG: hypothetical protein OEV31_08325, partial [Gammaproteobacteria bacterium]|nr:hypothetical protein [Gammaproteobacteria bacterium]